MQYRDKATLWQLLSQDEFGGSTYGGPVTIDCNIASETGLKFDKAGKVIKNVKILYTEAPCSIGDYAELSEVADTAPTDTAFQITNLIENSKTPIKKVVL